MILNNVFYRSARFTRVCNRTRGVVPWLENIANTMTLPSQTWQLVHFELNLSPIRLFTLFFPSFPNKLNLLSSLKNTFAQFSYVQNTYLFANSNLFFLFFELTSGFFLGVRLNSHISCSRLETVCLDTFSTWGTIHNPFNFCARLKTVL